MFVGVVPVGTYTAGEVIPLNVKLGPSSVRDGYGTAILKGVYTGGLNTDVIKVETVVQNSNQIDPIINSPNELNNTLGVSIDGTGYQAGHDCPLDVNSTWTVYAKVVKGGTTTKAFGLYAIIEIDYPSVGSVADPRHEQGTPMSIEMDKTVTVFAPGSIDTATWNIYNIDNFKPGFRYLLEKIGVTFPGGVGGFGFVAFSGAAAQNGLTRIIPFSANIAAVAEQVTYSSVLTKGPMDVRFMVFGSSAGSDTAHLVTDYIRR